MESSAPALNTIREQVEATRMFVAKYQDRVLDLMAGNEAGVKRFYQTFSICLAQEPKLATCSRASLIGGMLEIAALNLEPGVLGEAWLIPFRNRERKSVEATVIIGYKGLLKLAYRSADVGKIVSGVVFEKDDFDWLEGTTAYLKFKKGQGPDRGKMVAAWALAERAMSNGAISRPFEVMLDYEIIKIRDNAPSAKAATSPWKTEPEAMWRKTVLRRLCKFLPSKPEEDRMIRAVGLDEAIDARVSQNLRARADDLPDLPVVETDGEAESDDGDDDAGAEPSQAE